MERIVVGIGGEAPSALAVEWTMARAATRRVSVDLVTVIDPRLTDILSARARLGVYRDAFVAALPDAVVTVSAVEGAVPDALGLASLHADLLVIGSHRSRPVSSALRGSMASRIASSACCPTVLVPDDWSRESGDGPVLVGFEVEGNSDSALIFAAQEAASQGSELHIVHSWRLPPSSVGALKAMVAQRPQERPWHRRLLDRAARKLAADHPGLSIRQELSDSFPAVALEELGRDAALIVVGTHGRGPVAGLILGSTSGEVMRHSSVPLCVVPPSEEPPLALDAGAPVLAEHPPVQSW